MQPAAVRRTWGFLTRTTRNVRDGAPTRLRVGTGRANGDALTADAETVVAPCRCQCRRHALGHLAAQPAASSDVSRRAAAPSASRTTGQTVRSAVFAGAMPRGSATGCTTAARQNRTAREHPSPCRVGTYERSLIGVRYGCAVVQRATPAARADSRGSSRHPPSCRACAGGRDSRRRPGYTMRHDTP